MRALRLIREVRGAWRQNLEVREIMKLSDSPYQKLARSPIHLWVHHPKRQALRCKVSHGPEHAPYSASTRSVLSVCRKCDSKNLSLVETRRESSERIAMDQGKISPPGRLPICRSNRHTVARTGQDAHQSAGRNCGSFEGLG